jgi:hypothetical protein
VLVVFVVFPVSAVSLLDFVRFTGEAPAELESFEQAKDFAFGEPDRS